MTIKLVTLFAIVFQIMMLSGCTSSSVLPHEKEIQESQWTTFDSVKESYDEIEPMVTTLKELSDYGFNPYTASNIKILSYLDIIERFIPNASIQKEDLDPHLINCIADTTKCVGYEIDIGKTDKERHGNVFMDMFKFKRKTKVSGWRFKSLFVIHDDKVIYKLWSGSPKIDKYYYRDRPLGPLQDSSDALKSITDDAIGI